MYDRKMITKNIEFIPFWPFLVCCSPLFSITFRLNKAEEHRRKIKSIRLDSIDDYIDFEIVLFNIELLGLYIDAWKVHIGLLGFGINIWYERNK